MKNPGMKVPLVIGAEQVFDLDGAAKALALTKRCLLREVRLRRLRVSRRGGRYYVLGSWLLAWIEAGRKRETAPPAAPELNGRN